MRKSLPLVLMTLLIILFSCKKDVDENLPQIQISLPFEGNAYGYEDEIRIKATVTDDINLERIEVKITNSAGQVFLMPISYMPSVKSKTIDTFITNNDFYLESGTYYVTVVAFDGVNEKVAFRSITIEESARQLLYPIVISESNIYNTQIERINGSSFLFHAGLYLNYDQATFDSRNQILHYTGEGVLQSYNFDPVVLISSTILNTSTGGIITSSFADDATNESYFATSDGGIWRTGSSAIPSVIINQTGTFRALDLLVMDNKIMALENSVTGSEPRIAVYNKFSGILEQSVALPLSFEVKKIIDIGETNRFMVIGNSTGQSLFQYYNLNTSTLNDVPDNYNNVIVDNAWPGQDGSFYVSHATQLTTYSNNMLNWFSGLNISALKVVYDDPSNTNYVLTNTGLKQLDSGLGSVINFTPVFYAPLDLLMVYNK
jgi:hypothetical protein